MSDCSCDDCKPATCPRCYNAPAEHWVTDKFNIAKDDKQSYKVCEPCLVRLWPCPISVVFHFGVPPFVEESIRSKDFLDKIETAFDGTAGTVHYFHRREAETTRWLANWCVRSKYETPTDPYSYRGWCSGREIVILVDEVETKQSVRWVTLHELGHLAVNQQAQFIDRAMSQENVNEGRQRQGYEWKDDSGHEADSEERLVNRIATAYMEGREYARPWWRERVNARLAGFPIDEWPDNPRRPTHFPQDSH